MIAVTFTSAVDDPRRFAKSAALGAHFGLTPKKYQSGERDVTGAISKTGDGLVRAALYEAAHIMLTRTVRFRPSRRGMVGCQLSSCRASVMSGQRCLGSSGGSGV